MHQVAQVDLVTIVKRRRQVVFFDLALAFPGVLRVGRVAQIEFLIHRRGERLETAAAPQLEGRLHAAGKPELPLVLENVERERDRLDDPKVLVRLELVGTLDLLDPVLRRPDLVQIQEEHEPPNIPWNRGFGKA
ncbi:MAG TPA: hypothetical protein VKI43_18970 [Vicinamibacterales bacterium]|nr:hypothetical protein [Vicinamibacterales bacterium]